MVITGGVNVYPREIEECLLGHDEIVDCAVLGIPDDEWGEVLYAIVQPTPGSTLDEAARRRPTCASTWPTTSGRGSWSSSRSCPGTRTARSASPSSARRTSRAGSSAVRRDPSAEVRLTSGTSDCSRQSLSISFVVHADHRRAHRRCSGRRDSGSRRSARRSSACSQGNDRHPTVDSLYDAARTEMPTISLKTVYQTVHDLERSVR